MFYLEGKKNGTVVATDFTEDRDGEKIDVSGLDISNFKKNPVLLFGHNHQNLPVGSASKIKVEGKKLTFEPIFSATTQFARDVKALWDEGVLRAVSIGFIPKEREKNVFTKSELLEISVVNVPANPNALAQAKAKGLNTELVKEVSGNRNLDIFPVNRDWDSAQAVQRIRSWAGGPDKDDIDFNRYKQAFAWRDEQDPENFTSYKLPFADVDGDAIKAVPRGVFAAQAALLGARGGVDIPEDDRRKVHNLLGSYYKKMDRAQPEFRGVDSVADVIKLVENKSLLKEDGFELIALHRKAGESVVDDSSSQEEVEAVSKNEDVLADALHLALQHINKASNQALKVANDVRRKERPQKGS